MENTCLMAKFIFTHEYLFIIFIVLVITGFFGGLVNYFILKEKEQKVSFWTSVLTAIAASLTLPFFLHMISSNLLKNTKQDFSLIYVIAGMSLIVAIFSRNFLQTMYRKLVREVEQLKEEVQKTKNEPDTEVPDDSITDDNLVPYNISQQELKVMKKMIDTPYPSRSLNGLRRDTGIDKNELNTILAGLVGKDFIEKAEIGTNQFRWHINKKGCSILTELAKLN